MNTTKIPFCGLVLVHITGADSKWWGFTNFNLIKRFVAVHTPNLSSSSNNITTKAMIKMSNEALTKPLFFHSMLFFINTNLNKHKKTHYNFCMEEMTLVGFVLEPWGKVGSFANTAADMKIFKIFTQAWFFNQKFYPKGRMLQLNQFYDIKAWMVQENIKSFLF